MASEVTISASLTFDDLISDPDLVSLSELVVTLGSAKYIKHTQTIGITEEAIVLGEITAPGWSIFKNMDPTNYVDIKVATAGAIFARLDAATSAATKGGIALLKLGSGAQAPFAIANSAPCKIVYLICYT